MIAVKCSIPSHRPPDSVHFSRAFAHRPRQNIIPQILFLHVPSSPQYACTN
ncbi:hypothetical protein PMIN01_12866 [Paraphaeosphaeria minitans]|uniref:Uncharacterized protein n=1 Tax=Paraphaeosphaeria minitans TaxID=565426 RepID=A0A9P6KK30_9PLEO|nr:hypothetical protein PMIN01_12866 [Paraphaeosphaeria minitans]